MSIFSIYRNRKGTLLSSYLNAADEVLVDAFINQKITYTQIPSGIEKVMNLYEERSLSTIDEILAFDKEVKRED